MLCRLGEGSHGVAIILFTLLLKTVTFPLNYAQIESTTKMQALQRAGRRAKSETRRARTDARVLGLARAFLSAKKTPLSLSPVRFSYVLLPRPRPAIKRIQAKYASDPQQMNLMMAELYSENELNPLAGPPTLPRPLSLSLRVS